MTKKLLAIAIAMSFMFGTCGAVQALTILRGAGTDPTKGSQYLDTTGAATTEGNAAVIANKNAGENQTYVTTSQANQAYENSDFTVKSGTWDAVYVGRSSDATAVKNNAVTITGGTVTKIYGGFASAAGDVKDNRVTINGGTVSGTVYGGRSAGKVTNNTVTISGTGANTDLTNATLYGYETEYTPPSEHSGNTLNIASEWTGTVKSIQNFDSFVNEGNLTVSDSITDVTTMTNKSTGTIKISADNLTTSITSIANDGTLELTGGTLAKAVDKSSTNADYGTLDLKKATEIAAQINNQDIKLSGEYSTVTDSSYISDSNNKLTFNGGGFDFTDGQVTEYKFNEINLTGDGHLKLDVDLDGSLSGGTPSMDRISASNVSETSTLHITALTLLTEAKINKTPILFADSNLKARVQNDVTGELHVAGNTQNYTVAYDPATGYFTFTKIGGGQEESASETTKAVSDTATMMSFAWINTINNLQKRMGDLRGGAASNMAWARFQRNNDDVNVGRSQNLSGNLYQLGYDFLIKSNDVAKNFFGLSVDVFDGSQSFKIGGGDAKSTTLSAYYTKVYESGHYFDFIFRYGRFESDTQSYDAGIATKLDYAMNGITLSGEYGYRANLGMGGLYLEPQAEFIYGYLAGAKATSSTNYLADIDSTNHFVGRLGLAFGQRVKNFNYYLRGSYYHDFAGTTHVKYGDATYKQEGAQNWWELSLGGGWNLSRVSYFYAELTKHFKDISNSLNFNVGFRLTL